MTVTISLELLMTALLGIGGIAVGYGVMRATVSGFERRINELEIKLADHAETLKIVTRLEEQMKSMREELHRIASVFDRARLVGK